MTTWHYERQGQRVGPIPESEIQTLIETSVLHTDTLVWSSGLPDWVPLVDSPLAVYLWQMNTPPTLPSHTISNVVVWFLAFAPILGLMLQSFVAGMLASNAYSAEAEATQALQSGRFWYLTLLLNIGLSLLDLKRLKAAGSIPVPMAGWCFWCRCICGSEPDRYISNRSPSGFGVPPLYCHCWPRCSSSAVPDTTKPPITFDGFLFALIKPTGVLPVGFMHFSACIRLLGAQP